MAALPKDTAIAVIGTGTMGGGIAQVAAAAGHRVLLFDTDLDGPGRAVERIADALERLVRKARMTASTRADLLTKLQPCTQLRDLAPARLAVEAIVEDLEAKRELFTKLEKFLSEDAILGTNTSSLSVTAIAAKLARPERLVGMHFFNPVPRMGLVEVVSGLATAPAAARTVFDTAAAWGKEPVHAKSTPGFIVNRVARPFYAEALRVLGEGGADAATLDAVMRESGKFRMGPFELMDLIGHDVNYAVTRSVFDAYFGDPRFTPSIIQQELVLGGRLGRKSGRGFFDYTKSATCPEPAAAEPAPAPSRVCASGTPGLLEPLIASMADAGIAIDRDGEQSAELLVDGAVGVSVTDGRCATERMAQENSAPLVVLDLALDYASAGRVALAAADQISADQAARAIGLFQALGKTVSMLDDVPGLIGMRTVCMLANEAADAVNQGICSAPDVETAMRRGVNYPLGPLTWAERIGVGRVVEVLDNLARTYGEDRYRVSPLLRRAHYSGEKLS